MNQIRDISINDKLEIYKKAYFIREFEKKVAENHVKDKIKIPIYLSIGQELIAATLGELLKGIPIFAQHRAHSYFLAFGGDPHILKNELIDSKNLSDFGKLGSASIASAEINMFGHSGFMGDQVPIAVGYSLSKQVPVLSVVGDASAEEDYVLGALGYAASKHLPVLIICEDNNLSILTPKKVRRTWSFSEVAKSLGAKSQTIPDCLEQIWNAISDWNFQGTLVLNIDTERHLWHSGSGMDGEPVSDRLLDLKLELNELFEELNNIENEIRFRVEEIWKN